MTTDHYGILVQKIQERSARTAVIGLGYVGLPLAALSARAGFHVTGIERDPDRVLSINRGHSYIELATDANLGPLVRTGHLCATSDYSVISQADVVAICVPTHIDENKRPVTSHLDHALETAGPYLHAGQLVVLESTTYPGTTEEVLLPHLNALGLKTGTDVYLAFSPERIDPGNSAFPVEKVPRLVGGITSHCTEVAQLFYQQIIEAPIIPVSSPKVAEMSKLFENVFRSVNVSLVNELAQLCDRMGVDVWEVVDAAKTKPYGFMPFYPGPGAGGHCIPIDPFYLSWKARQFGFESRFIELAGEINDGMPRYVESKVAEVLSRHGKSVNGSRILICGFSFKPDVADLRESPSVKIAGLLLERGAELSYHDPHVPLTTFDGRTYESVPLTAEFLGSCDLVVIGTHHTNTDYALIVESGRPIYDTRNALKQFRAKNVFRLGAPAITPATDP